MPNIRLRNTRKRRRYILERDGLILVMIGYSYRWDGRIWSGERPGEDGREVLQQVYIVRLWKKG